MGTRDWDAGRGGEAPASSNPSMYGVIKGSGGAVETPGGDSIVACLALSLVESAGDLLRGQRGGPLEANAGPPAGKTLSVRLSLLGETAARSRVQAGGRRSLAGRQGRSAAGARLGGPGRSSKSPGDTQRSGKRRSTRVSRVSPHSDLFRDPPPFVSGSATAGACGGSQDPGPQNPEGRGCFAPAPVTRSGDISIVSTTIEAGAFSRAPFASRQREWLGGEGGKTGTGPRASPPGRLRYEVILANNADDPISAGHLAKMVSATLPRLIPGRDLLFWRRHR